MSGAIGPGDWVEAVCSIESEPRAGCLSSITQGAIYLVREIGDSNPDFGCGHCGEVSPFVTLSTDDPSDEYGWCPCAFRPIYRPRPETFSELLKTPIDAPSKEPVAA